MASGELDEALQAAEDAAATCLRAATTVARELKRAQSSARVGALRELRRATAAARTQWAGLGERLDGLDAAYDIDETAYLTDGRYVRDVLAAAEDAGVVISADPDATDRLLSYPSVIRIVPRDAAVEVDKKRDQRLRPSVLVARLARTQQREPPAGSGRLLEALATARDLLIARDHLDPGAVVRLDAVWRVLTMLPGAAADYGRPEFARDLYLLDQSGRVETADGRQLRFAASSGTRGPGVLTTVARDGRQQLYWGIAFDAVAPGATAGVGVTT